MSIFQAAVFVRANGTGVQTTYEWNRDNRRHGAHLIFSSVRINLKRVEYFLD
ncbi:MAG TPA: hypothetical protein VJ969_07260 [Desulfopila sp.]|nr:hypothetical protein [Desulfopila sp.]